MTHSDDPFIGTWKLNPGKSKFDVNHRPSQATMLWERTPQGYHMRAEGLKEDGQPVVEQATFVPDGQEHPIAAAPEFTGVCEQPDPHTLHCIGRKDGEVVGEATYTVSADGGTLTASVRGIDVEQRPFQTVVAWDRS